MNRRIKKKKETQKRKRLVSNQALLDVNINFDANFDNPGLPSDEDALKK